MKNFNSISLCIMTIPFIGLWGFKNEYNANILSNPSINCEKFNHKPETDLESNDCFVINSTEARGYYYATAKNLCNRRIKASFEIKYWNGYEWLIVKGLGGTRYNYVYLDAFESKIVVEEHANFDDYQVTPISSEYY